MTVAAPPITRLTNYINGQWTDSRASEWRDVVNPATGEVLAQVPLAEAAEVNQAIEAAAAAFPEWRRTPPEDRIQPLFKLKMLLEDHIDDIARIITQENGKTFTEAKAEMRRAIENVEVACGIPMMMQGYNLEDVARGIDEMMIRQPLGVTAAIVPFNFPGMIAVLVSALRHRHRQHIHSQAQRARAAHHALCLRTAGKNRLAQGRRKPG